MKSYAAQSSSAGDQWCVQPPSHCVTSLLEEEPLYHQRMQVECFSFMNPNSSNLPGSLVLPGFQWGLSLLKMAQYD